MKNKDLIHIQVGYEEALKSKKEILSSEINLLNIKKDMKSYHFLRKNELKTKLKLYRKIKEVVTIINRLQKELPEINIPRHLVKEKIPENKKDYVERKIERTREIRYDKNLENQLREIQEKLRALNG